MRKLLVSVIAMYLLNTGEAQKLVSSRLVDELQQPVSGVTISTGKDLNTISDNAGNFSISIPPGYSNLHFSSIGFLPFNYDAKAGLPPVIVLTRNSQFLEEAVVKAFERYSKVNNIPASVAVLNRTQLNRYSTPSFVAALNTVPGVKMDERSPGSYRLSIRGNLLRSAFGVRNVKVYWNGIPFTDANGNTYINELSPINIGKIEILKGPSGSMYGAGTGGVVLLSSALGTAEKKLVNLHLTGGSYGLFSGNIGYEQTGINSQAINYSHQQSDGYREQSAMRRDVLNYTGSFKLNSRQRINANVFYSDLYYQTPGGLTLVQRNANPRQARPAAGPFNGAVAQKAALYLKTIYAGVGHEIQLGKYWNNNSSVYSSYTDFKNPTIRNYERKYEQGIGGRTVFQFHRSLFSYTMGGEYQLGHTNTSVHGNRLGQKDTLQYKDLINAAQYNIFAQADVILLDDFNLTAGISYNNFHYGFNRISDILTKESRDFKGQFVPRIAASMKVAGMHVYAAVSKGFSPPGIDEIHASNGIFNRQLEAEKGLNYEAGLKGVLVQNKLWLDASVYFFKLQQTIVSRRDSSGAEYYVNAGQTRQPGVEASLNYVPVNRENGFFRTLRLFTNYTYSDAHFINYQQGANKFDGNKLTGTPSTVWAAGAELITAPGVYLNVGYNYTGTIPLNDANSFFAERYNLLFVKLGKLVKVSTAITADAYAGYDCSFNNPYSLGNDLNAAGNRFFNPSSPQNFSLGARFQFSLKK